MPQVNPALPIVGQSDSSEDPKIVTALSTLVAAVNSVDDAQIAAAAGIQQSKLAAPTDYNTLLAGGGQLGAAVVSAGASSLLGIGAASNASLVGATNTLVNIYAAHLDPADFAVTGRAAKYRLRVRLDVNGVTPGGDFTLSLMRVTTVGLGAAGSGQYVSAVASPVGTVTFTAPAFGFGGTQASADFAAPTAGLYAVVVSNSATTAINSVVSMSFALQRRTV